MTTTNITTRQNVITKFVSPFNEGRRYVTTFDPTQMSMDVSLENTDREKTSLHFVNFEAAKYREAFALYAAHKGLERWEMSY